MAAKVVKGGSQKRGNARNVRKNDKPRAGDGGTRNSRVVKGKRKAK